MSTIRWFSLATIACLTVPMAVGCLLREEHIKIAPGWRRDDRDQLRGQP